jgi:hypothetical protein
MATPCINPTEGPKAHPPTKQPSISGRLKEFGKKPSSSRLRAGELQETFKGFFAHLLQKKILHEAEGKFEIRNVFRLEQFCRNNILPITTQLAEEGVHLGTSFKFGYIILSDIFHRPMMGGCPVFFRNQYLKLQNIHKRFHSTAESGWRHLHQ